eukprot:8505029-Alexandrium_andersonii.AAC.1
MPGDHGSLAGSRRFPRQAPRSLSVLEAARSASERRPTEMSCSSKSPVLRATAVGCWSSPARYLGRPRPW